MPKDGRPQGRHLLWLKPDSFRFTPQTHRQQLTASFLAFYIFLASIFENLKPSLTFLICASRCHRKYSKSLSVPFDLVHSESRRAKQQRSHAPVFDVFNQFDQETNQRTYQAVLWL
jgi:hypothetical protein